MEKNKINYKSYEEIAKRYEALKDDEIYQFADPDCDVYPDIKILDKNLKNFALEVAHLKGRSYGVVKNFMDLFFYHSDKEQFYYLIYTLLLIYQQPILPEGRSYNDWSSLLTNDEKDEKLSNNLYILQNLPDKRFLKTFASSFFYTNREETLLNEKVLLKEILDYRKDNQLKKYQKYKSIINMLNYKRY
ncbi:hypothetical protein HDR59_04265 [bacterium]|nr:hypothetical protein [bacterium]